jgi:hypothetical protein
MIALAALLAAALSASGAAPGSGAAPAAGAPACSLPPLRPGPPPWRSGEALAWDLDVMGVVKAGALDATVLAASDGALPIRARARNTSVFAKVRRVRGVAHAWVDAKTLRPKRYRDEADDDGVRWTTEVRLDRPGPKVAMHWSAGATKGTREFDRRGDVADLLSAIYYLRAADLAEGRPFCFDLVANRRFWRLEGAVAPGTERVETPAGAFEAFRVDLTLTRDPIPGDERVRTRPLHVWFSADARRVPVAGVSEVDLGPVRALLAGGATPPKAGQP